jgi:hypothetical protein
MATSFVDFQTLGPDRLADAARILRAALAALPSGYRESGTAEAEVALRRNQDDWLGYAAVDGEHLVGWIGAIMASSAEPKPHRWRSGATTSGWISQPCA